MGFKKIIAALLIIAMMPVSAVFAESDGIVYGFNDYADIEKVSVSNTGLGAELDYSEVYNSIVVRLNYTQNTYLEIKHDTNLDSSYKYMKIRYYVTGDYNETAFVGLPDNEHYLGETAFNAWDSKIINVSDFDLSGDKIRLSLMISEDWTTNAAIYVDYIGFFRTETEALSYSEKDDDDSEKIVAVEQAEEEEIVIEKTMDIDSFTSYINGYSKREFKPENNITRAEAAAIASRMAASEREIKDKYETGFSDVVKGEWYYDYVAYLENAKCLGMYEGVFSPDTAITRAEFVALMYNIKLIKECEPKEFSDVSAEHPYYTEIGYAGGSGVITGYTDGEFKPDNPITRAEAVSVINRSIGVEADLETLEAANLDGYSDVDNSYWAYADIMIASFGLELSGGNTAGIASAGKYDTFNEAAHEWIPVPLVSQKQRDMGISGGEGGQVCLGVIGDSNDGNLMFSLTDTGYFFRTTNGGETWETVGKGTQGGAVQYAAIDPNNEERVLALSVGAYYMASPTTGGIYLSTDMGYSFKQKTHIGMPNYGTAFFDTIAYDAGSYDEKIDGSAVAYWATYEETYGENYEVQKLLEKGGLSEGYGIYKTEDGGETWKRINSEFGKSIIKVHPTNGNLYVVNTQGFFVSEDGGATFTQTYEGVLTGLDVINTKPDNVYVCDNVTGVLVSEDCGKTFKKVTQSGAITLKDGCDRLFSLRVSPVNPNNMMIGADGSTWAYEAWYSHDGGDSWSTIEYDDSNGFFGKSPRAWFFYWSPVNEDYVWASGADWVTSSKDAGQTFGWDQEGNLGACINCRIGINVYNPDIIFLPIQDFTDAVSFDGGYTWETKHFPFKQAGTHLYGGYAVDENTYFFGHCFGWDSPEVELCITFDGGETLTETGIMTKSDIGHRYTQSPNDPKVLFADNYRSADGGLTWKSMEPYCRNVLTFNPYGEKEMYGIDATGQKVMVTYDEGATWQVFYDATDENFSVIADVEYDGLNDILYFTYMSTVYQSKETNGFYLPGIRVSGLPKLVKVKDGKAEDISAPVYEAAPEGGGVRQIAVDPRHPDVMYAALIGTVGIAPDYKFRANRDQSILRSCDRGETWQMLSTDPDISIVKTGQVAGYNPKDINVHPTTGEFYINCHNYGLWKFPPPYTE